MACKLLLWDYTHIKHIVTNKSIKTQISKRHEKTLYLIFGCKCQFYLFISANNLIIFPMNIFLVFKGIVGNCLQLVSHATSAVTCPSRRAGERAGGISEKPAISLWSTTGLKRSSSS